jgi:cation diffusion facilitator CzcD-associated flavoprotein CzcO
MKGAERRARKHLESQVRDPELRAKLTPTFRFGCKRILISDTYLASLDQPNVGLVTDAITEITQRGLVDAAGREHQVDVIIYGTGFHTARLTLTDHIHGPGGMTMAESWDGNPSAYLGTSVTGFPNCYLIHGPNVGLGHNSVIHMIESQAIYIAAAVRYVSDHRLAAIEPSAEAHRAFAAEVDRMSEGTVWTAGGCESWYLENGRNSNLWPGTATNFRRRALRFDPADHVVRHRSAALIAG